MKKALSTLLFILCSYLAQAHTVWITAPQKAKLGEIIHVKVYFGEFTWEKPTVANKWFSDIRRYKLMMQAPDGTISELTDKRENVYYFYTALAPSQEGTYVFWLEHEVKDIHKDKKLTYASAAVMHVGKKTSPVRVGQGPHQLEVNKTKRGIEYTYLYNGKPGANQVLEVIKEGQAEHLTVSTDKHGKLIIPAEWKGNYLIEIPDSQKVENGLHNGKKYDYDYKVFCYYLTL